MSESRQPRVLILFASTHGQTEKIASQLGVTMGLCDLQVVVRDVRRHPDEDPRGYDAVVVAASIHAGHHQGEIVDWVKRHVDALGTVPNAFVSVSLSAAEEDDEAREATLEYIDDFSRDTGWTPNHTAPVAGALLYREYNPFTRILMKLLMKKGGHHTDTLQDYEYTDWEALARFGQEISADFKERVREGASLGT
jgi:menaquinone-dependent protoporphyrinogen oxidase